MLVVGPLSLDLKEKEAQVCGKIVDLTLREFELLKYLATRLGQVVTSEELLKEVWKGEEFLEKYGKYVSVSRVDVTVEKIREKIKNATMQVKISISIEQIDNGYCLNINPHEKFILNVGQLSLDLQEIEAQVCGKIVDLTLREFELLKYLATKPGQVITKKEILDEVWRYSNSDDERIVEITISRIRDKIEKEPRNPTILLTKMGIGYYLNDNEKTITSSTIDKKM